MRTKSKKTEDVVVLGDVLDKILQRLDALEQKSIANQSEGDDGDDVQEMFDMLQACDLPRSTHRFVQSLWYDFDRNGWLSREQYRCLKRNYNKWVHHIGFQVR